MQMSQARCCGTEGRTQEDLPVCVSALGRQAGDGVVEGPDQADEPLAPVCQRGFNRSKRRLQDDQGESAVSLAQPLKRRLHMCTRVDDRYIGYDFAEDTAVKQPNLPRQRPFTARLVSQPTLAPTRESVHGVRDTAMMDSAIENKSDAACHI